MIYTRLFEYDSLQESNSYRGTDYTKYIMLGDTVEDRLNEVLGTVELTLAGLPFGEEFTPQKKFIYEVWQGEPEAVGSSLQYYHVCVQEDIVSKPILSDENYYDHHITFIEASAVAQSRIVDNISVTYKLKDVTLDSKTAIDLDQNVQANFQDVETVPIGGHSGGFYIRESYNELEYSIGKRLKWDNTVKSQWQSVKYYQSVPAGGTATVTLPIPMLEILNGRSVNNRSNVYEHLGYCSLVTTVVETNVIDQTQTVRKYYTNPCRNQQSEAWNYNNNWDLNTVYNNQDTEGVVLNRLEYYQELPVPIATVAYRTHVQKIAEYEDTVSNREISILIKPNCTYTVTTTLKNNFAYYSHGYVKNIAVWVTIKNDAPTYYTDNGFPVATMSFATYSESDYGQVLFWHAPEANAYDLFQKAQIATQNILKKENVPIDEQEQTFYLAPEDKLKLQNTQIVENFYYQKNFWEILLDIGKYIHSIPKIEFGENDRFIVKWRELGKTEQRKDSATQISIFNSRSLENYVASCSSYISNMVQLGGVIDEWVAPKSSSEDYLVYNDVAEIKTSKPIIEIVSMEVKCINNNYSIDPQRLTQTLTPSGENGYVFEENVYNILGIDWPYSDPSGINWARVASKGFAVYYTLGTNIIKGLNYQLPTVNVGDYPSNYAIKNILGVLFKIGYNGNVPNFGAWANIKVNDFVFHIVYRTKDSVRSDQSRPDLCKYLLASKFDKVPQHYQFNNQTDTVVDSVKFGNNIYGKLIRTGNTEYTETQWCDNLYATKNVGELYNIRGELYYVSSVRNTNYKTHIISEVIYSKDYNQLSEIIGIPSEPRFYEISEQSLLDREVSLNEYIVLGTQIYGQIPTTHLRQQYFIRSAGWNYIRNLLFRNENAFPKYAISIFKNDIDKKGDISGNETFYKEVCSPVNPYSVHNTLTLEWDMEDNFSAGDKVVPTDQSVSTATSTTNGAYNKLYPVKYTDVYGRSDLFDFIVLTQIDDISANIIQELPESPYRLRFSRIKRYVGEYICGQVNYPNEEPAIQLPSDGQLNNFTLYKTNSNPMEDDGVLVDESAVSGYSPDYHLYLFKNNEWRRDRRLMDYEAQLMQNGQVNWNSRPLTSEAFAPIALFSDNTHDIGGTEYFTLNSTGIGLLKDNREAIHINYNLQAITDGNGFVLSSYLWQPAKGTLKLALLNTEINNISNNTIPQQSIITDEYIIHAPDPDNEGQYIDNTTVSVSDYGAFYNTTLGNIRIKINDLLSGVDLTNVKAIAIISDNLVAGNPSSDARYFVMGRNISGLTEADAKSDWYISNYSKNMFPHQ